MRLIKQTSWPAGFMIVTFFFVLFFSNSACAESSKIDRLEGSNRYETAVAISQEGWISSDYAVLVRGDDFADGLCAGPLAAKYNAPILMTRPETLFKVTLDELKRLGVKHLLIAGGTAAISQEVEQALIREGFTDIRRFGGQNRYETSVKIAQELSGNRVAIATGEKYPDALSISVPAVQYRMPILLTAQQALPDCVKTYLQTASTQETYIIGGEGVISRAVENAVPNPKRLSGSNRYLTNISVMQHFEAGLDFSRIFVADGAGPNYNEFADALAGSVLAAKSNSPLILADINLPGATGNYLKSKITVDTRVTGLGGENAVPSSLLRSIPDLLLTENGSLILSPGRAKAGDTRTISLTYTLGEDFTHGTVEFILPEAIRAADGQYQVTAASGGLNWQTVQLTENGGKVTVYGVTGKSGQKIMLSLNNKALPFLASHSFRIVGDADGLAMGRLPSRGIAQFLIVNSPQLESVQQQLIGMNRSYRYLEPQGFVIHSTASPGGTAQFIYDYFNSRYRAASAHYVADWNEIIQLIPEHEVAWHAGPTANSRYLSVEMCEPKGKNQQEFQKVWDRTVMLVADACLRYGWNPREKVFSHNTISLTYHESDHSDPIGYFARYNRTWGQLIQAIEAKMNELREY